MTDILVQPPQLRQVAEQLRSNALKIDQALQSIDQNMNSLKGSRFLGNRADILQSNYTRKRDALIHAKSLVVRFSSELFSIAAVFENADNALGPKPSGPLSMPEYVVNVPPRTFALFSQLAYSDAPELPEELKSQGWEVLCTAKDLNKNQDGYSGVAFINPRTGEVVIAHRGTDQWNFNPFNGKSSDVDDDASIRLGAIPDQYYVSREFVDGVKEKLKYDARFSDYTLVHTGHSLGAALSDLNAVTDDVKGIAFDNPGTLQIIKNHQDIFSPDNRENLVSYQSNPNLVHLGGENAGYVVDIIPEKGGPVNPLTNISPGIRAYDEFKQTEIHHSMDNIVNSISPETGFPIGYFPPSTGEGNHGFHNLGDLRDGRVGGTANACYAPPPLPEI